MSDMKCHSKMILLYGVIISIILSEGCTFRIKRPFHQVDITPYLSEASELASARHYSAAINTLEQAATLATTDVRPLVQIGQIYLKQRRWSPAREVFNQALAREPNNRTAILGLAEALLGEGQAVEATNVWRQAVALDKSQADGWMGLGRAYLARQNYTAAQEAFITALGRAPDPEAQWYLAALTIPIDFVAGRTQLKQMKALTHQRDYLLAALDPFNAQSSPAEIAKIAGITFIQLEAWPLAHHALSVATAQNPSDPQAWAFLGHTQGILGLPAIAAFNQAREIDPELALVPYFEGIYLRKHGLHDLAVDRFLKALELDPNNLGVALETAQTLAEKGDYLSAEAWYQSLVEVEPESSVYQEFLTAFYVERSYRVVEVGLMEAERLVVLDPTSARAYDLLGWARFQTGDLPGAEVALRQALELDPASIAPHYHLGRLLEVLRRDVEAQEEFTRVIDWDHSGVYRERVLGAN